MFDFFLKLLTIFVVSYCLIYLFMYNYQFDNAKEQKACGVIIDKFTVNKGRAGNERHIILKSNHGKLYDFKFHRKITNYESFFINDIDSKQRVCFTYFVSFSNFFDGEYVLKSIHME